MPSAWIKKQENNANAELKEVKVIDEGDRLVIEACVFAPRAQPQAPLEPQVEAKKTKITCSCGQQFDDNKGYCTHAMETGHRGFKS